MRNLTEKQRADAIKYALSGRQKDYRHFDNTLSQNEAVHFLEDAVVHPAQYRFLPFIQFSIAMTRYEWIKKEDSETTEQFSKRIFQEAHPNHKKRKISLTSHHDSLYFRYYAALLNSMYESYLSENNLTAVPTAYRAGKKMSNVKAAKEVVDRIWDAENCWIIKGDFHHFFDCINHQILKQQLQLLMQCDRLPDEWFHLFQGITQYRFVSKKQLKQLIKSGHLESSKGDRSKPFVKNREELGALVHKKLLHAARNTVEGIPQGTSVSAVLANIYMLSFDQTVNRLVSEMQGIYRRYSDDFIIVIPTNKMQDISAAFSFKDRIIQLSKDMVDLTISKKKTGLYSFTKAEYRLEKVHEDTETRSPSSIGYLGFSFDGRTVSLRPGSINRYRYRGMRSLKRMAALNNGIRQVRHIKNRAELVASDRVWSSSKKKWVKSQSEHRMRLNRQLSNFNKFHSGHKLLENAQITARFLVHKPTNPIQYPKDSSSKKFFGNFMSYALRAQKTFSKQKGPKPHYNVAIQSQSQRILAQVQKKQHTLKVSGRIK
ncbi:reverse transcriptase domain-containing protein [Schleiferilactobacillus harbinensis]|uniref:reverse transcriptase domain-containing protein n=1 Tax=Schleiferilactobacillus harbinensis TaxID=304207 RepID=UPI00345E6E07